MSRFESAVAHWGEFEGLPSAFAAARDAVDAVLRDRGLRRTGPDTAAAALERGAEASAEFADADDLATGEAAAAGSAQAVRQAALRVNSDLLALVPVVGRSPVQALARMHALTGFGDLDSLGRPRGDDGVAPALQAFGHALLDTEDEPGLVVAALAHAEVRALRPFETGNGVVARALERLLLVARGVDPASSLVPEAGHLALRGQYGPALAAYSGGGLDGAAAWLDYAARATVAGIGASPVADADAG